MIFRSKSKKEAERYYLFAGMGWRASRRKRLETMLWTLAVGATVAALFALFVVMMNRPVSG